MPTEASPPPSSLDQAVLLWMQELSPYGVLVTDLDLRIRGWNHWLEQNSGRSAPQVVGTSLFETFPELTARRLDAYFQRALKGEVSVLSSAFHKQLLAFPPPMRGSGFSHMQQTARIAPLWQHGRIVGTITIIEDVTERDRQNELLEKQHQRDQLLTWSLTQLLHAEEPEPLVEPILNKVSADIGADTYLNYLADEGGHHLRLHGFRGLTAESVQEITLLKLEEAPHGRSAPENARETDPPAPACQALNAASAKGLGLRAYICHPMLVGHRLIGALSFGSRSRGYFEQDEVEVTRTVSQFVAGAIDRARRDKALRLAQQELSQRAADLEQKVQERTATLQETVAELETFSVSLAHDVRAPLRHIRGFAQALLNALGAESPEAVRNYAQLILQSSQRLDSLTKDILDYGKVAREPVRMAPVNLDETLRNVLSQNPALSTPGVVTVTPPLAPVLGVPNLLQQCLANLLDNALKFIPPGVDPRIEVYTELMEQEAGDFDATGGRTEPHWVRIWVEDNGIGIPPEYRGKIFGIFERLWNQDEFEGTGIGLAIVSKAIQRMGGNLGIESKSGRGSRFWLQLPATT